MVRRGGAGQEKSLLNFSKWSYRRCACEKSLRHEENEIFIEPEHWTEIQITRQRIQWLQKRTVTLNRIGKRFVMGEVKSSFKARPASSVGELDSDG